jgi:molybdopterin synthase catalytic subunit
MFLNSRYGDILSGCVVVIMGMVRNRRFTAEEVTGQNQVKASVQRKIRQSIADEVNVTTISILHQRYKTLKLIFI